MTIPLLDFESQLDEVGEAVKRAICEVIDSKRYILGPRVKELEERMADLCGTRHAIGVSSGTDALLAALMALHIGPGDVVLTTPYSFFATAGSISRTGGRPVFVDIEPDTYNMDPSALGRWFRNHPDQIEQVKAILPVHLFGQCANMDAILEIAGDFGVPVVEDAAQALGAVHAGKNRMSRAGSMGVMGCFSFFPSKNLGAAGDGGMVVTNDGALAERLIRLRNHGAEPKYHHALVGGNFRLDEIQAAVLLAKLPHLQTWHARRQENAAYYNERLQATPVATPAVAQRRGTHVYNQYVISVAQRDELRSYLHRHGVGTEVYYPRPLHLQDCFADLAYVQGNFPCSEHAAAHTLALPIHPGLGEEMLEYVASTIEVFYE